METAQDDFQGCMHNVPTLVVGQWREDILGAGFEAQLLPLNPDEEGEKLATLIAYRPERDSLKIPDTPQNPKFVFLYIHGWNDYYFQRELARHIAVAGGAFYAIDLNKYGRSMRSWQTPGWTESLKTYDEDIDAALSLISQERGELPLLLCGHSTGGLTASYWASRFPERLRGLVLNSPWIEMPGGTKQRKAIAMLAGLIAKKAPKKTLPGQDPDSAYGNSLAGWDKQVDGTLPEDLVPWERDPSITGWQIRKEWKGNPEAILRYGWMAGIAKVQADLLSRPAHNVPVFMATSTDSSSGKRSAKMMYSDSVLSVETLCENAWKLSTDLTLCRFPGKHDLLLSFPPERQEFWEALHKWLELKFPELVNKDLTANQRRAICP